ncbi:reverse transcriptase domain-containing protein [Mycobacterium kansasii]
MGSAYKILAKLLSQSLRAVLDKVISSFQSAFIWGRQIVDSVLVAHECIDSCYRAGRQGIVCKLDLEKAYDHVD